jgi:eukaryotic-like serine/threonine-protein kinase
MTPTTDKRLGPYEILSPLGAGGMGEVWRARDTRLDREVAIKVLPASFARDVDRLRRFEQEALATSALNHPNILTIYDVGDHEGTPFIVAELLEGEDLRAQLKEGALPARRAVEYAQQIAAGLATAHEKGIVHRDLKPENLFITTDGRVKILDFGLAKLKPSQVSGVDSQAPTQKKITDPGTVMGTVGYMSPEQVRGQEADHRADIFALGVILYEMLSGQCAFNGDSAIEVMNSILKEEPPELDETNTKISPQLEKIVRRCLEKKPERRFQSASDLGFALEALTTLSGSQLSEARAGKTPTQINWLSREKRLLAAASLLAIIALGFAWAYFTRQPVMDARVFRTSILPPEKASFGQVAVSPDGKWLAFNAATGGKIQLWLRALDTGETKPLPDTERANYPFWSPDSRWIGFFVPGKLKKMEISGGLPVSLCDARGGAAGGTWNRDGVILFSSVSGIGLSRVPATGGASTSVMRPDLKSQETSCTDPWFLPDGRHFLYTKGSGNKEISGIYLSSLDGGVNERLMGDNSKAVYAASGRGAGYLLFGREGGLMANPFDAVALRLTGEPFSIATKVGSTSGYVAANPRPNFSVSEDGVLVFDPHPKRERTQLMWVDRGGRPIAPLNGPLDGLDSVSSLRLSPDDQHFMVTRGVSQPSNSDLYLSDMTSGNPTPITFDPAFDNFPVWSPDGSRVVWASNRTGPFQLYVRAANGSGQDKLLLESDYIDVPTDWSQDGSFIIYSRIDPKTNQQYDVFVLPVAPSIGTPFPFLHTEASEFGGTLSPDRQWMAYSSDESGRTEVYVQSFPKGGSKRRVSTGGGGAPRWRWDGKELFYHAPDGKLMAAQVKGGASFEAGTPAPLFEFRAGGFLTTPYYSVTRDGQRFLLSTIVETVSNAPLTMMVNWTAGVKK